MDRQNSNAFFLDIVHGFPVLGGRSGVGKITLYKGKEVVKRNIDSSIAVDELINLLKENEVWLEQNEIA